MAGRRSFSAQWGLGLYLGVSGLKQEIASGLRAASHGQREAALSQVYARQELGYILPSAGWLTPAADLSASIST